MRFFSFSLLIGGGALLGHVYLWLRLVRRVVPPGRWRAVVGVFLAVMTGLLMFRGAVRGLGFPRVHDVVAYGWVAIALCLVIATLLGDVLSLALHAAGWLAGRRTRAPGVDAPAPAPALVAPPVLASPPADATPAGGPSVEARGVVRQDVEAAPAGDRPGLSRRRLLAAVPHGVLAGGGLLAGYGAYRAFTAPEITEVPVRIPRLPRSLDGLVVVQLTDVHVGSFIGRRFVDMLVDAANAAAPDLVVITGDLVDGSVDELGAGVAALRGLRSRFGTYFVTGNHEYYSGEDAWVRHLGRLGITVLRNRRVSIGDDGGSFDLVGVDDWSGGRRRGRPGYDLDAALVGRDPERAAVLLAHQPENFEVAVARGVDLQVSGHTHGGQLFPMSRLVSLRYPYDRGLFRRGDGHLYVSRGCGFWGPPSRIDSPPELVKLVLGAG